MGRKYHGTYADKRKRQSLSQFRAHHAAHCESLVEITGESVDLYRGLDRVPRVVLADWPCVGEYAGRFLLRTGAGAGSEPVSAP